MKKLIVCSLITILLILYTKELKSSDGDLFLNPYHIGQTNIVESGKFTLDFNSLEGKEKILALIGNYQTDIKYSNFVFSVIQTDDFINKCKENDIYQLSIFHVKDIQC